MFGIPVIRSGTQLRSKNKQVAFIWPSRVLEHCTPSCLQPSGIILVLKKKSALLTLLMAGRSFVLFPLDKDGLLKTFQN